MVFRNDALVSSMPRYPEDSIRAHHTGLVIAEVHVSDRGSVASIRLLQTVDTSISTEVEHVLKRWVFRPIKYGGTPIECQGRLLFYFRIVNGKAVVIDAVDEQLKRQHPSR
jgi:TonB family protein